MFCKLILLKRQKSDDKTFCVADEFLDAKQNQFYEHNFTMYFIYYSFAEFELSK